MVEVCGPGRVGCVGVVGRAACGVGIVLGSAVIVEYCRVGIMVEVDFVLVAVEIGATCGRLSL